MSRVYPSPDEVAHQQARAIRLALNATPGTPTQTRLLAAAQMLAQSITPLDHAKPTEVEAAELRDLSAAISRWTDIHSCDGAFAGAVEALTAGLDTGAA